MVCPLFKDEPVKPQTPKTYMKFICDELELVMEITTLSKASHG
jgi:hypothetical protein